MTACGPPRKVTRRADRHLDALDEDLRHEAEHQQGEPAMAAERVDRRLVLRVLGRQAAEELADVVALLQHDAPSDQAHGHPLDEVPGFLDRAVIRPPGAPQQGTDLEQRQRQRHRDPHVDSTIDQRLSKISASMVRAGRVMMVVVRPVSIPETSIGRRYTNGR